MKVLSYLELKNKTTQEQIKYKNWLNEKGYTDVVALQLFYSQPFKPELIEEYFAGFEKIDDKTYLNNETQVIITFFIDNTYDIEDQECIEYEFQKPRTLDDFINDCQRAGIELTWKEDKS